VTESGGRETGREAEPEQKLLTETTAEEVAALKQDRPPEKKHKHAQVQGS